jgi:hypothetical protein
MSFTRERGTEISNFDVYTCRCQWSGTGLTSGRNKCSRRYEIRSGRIRKGRVGGWYCRRCRRGCRRRLDEEVGVKSNEHGAHRTLVTSDVERQNEKNGVEHLANSNKCEYNSLFPFCKTSTAFFPALMQYARANIAAEWTVQRNTGYCQWYVSKPLPSLE